MVPAATYLAYTLIPVKELMAAAPPSRIDETTRMFEARLKNTGFEKAVWRETVSWCLLDHHRPPPILSQLTVREVCHFAISHSNNLKEGSGVGGVAFGLLQAMGRKLSQGDRRARRGPTTHNCQVTKDHYLGTVTGSVEECACDAVLIRDCSTA
jgi:hypothetical protein